MLDQAVKDELKAIVGEGRYFDNEEDLLLYSYDAFTVQGMPDVALLPVSTDEVSRIMKVASREKIPVTARGAGTNLTGGSVPVRGGIVLVFTKMNKILEIDKENRVAVVQPGVINMEFQKELAKQGLYYPPDPGSMAVSTMGGNVAENAGGPRAVKYGVTKDYLLGVEVVLASGEILRTGGKTLKNVSGYNLTQLFCGSEGTLGLITEMTFKLIPAPRDETDASGRLQEPERCRKDHRQGVRDRHPAGGARDPGQGVHQHHRGLYPSGTPARGGGHAADRSRRPGSGGHRAVRAAHGALPGDGRP